MARPRNTKRESREARLRERAAARGYTLVKERAGWYVELAGTRWGPMANLDEVDEQLPKDA